MAHYENITTYTVTKDHPVRIKFICENCGSENSTSMQFTSKSEVAYKGKNVPLKPSDSERINKEAQDRLNMQIQSAIKAESKGRYSFVKSDCIRCSKCNSLQSWASHMYFANMIAALVIVPIVAACAAILVGALTDPDKIFQKAPWLTFFGIAGVIMAGFCIYNIVMIVKSKAEKVTINHPTVDFNIYS